MKLVPLKRYGFHANFILIFLDLFNHVADFHKIPTGPRAMNQNSNTRRQDVTALSLLAKSTASSTPRDPGGTTDGAGSQAIAV